MVMMEMHPSGGICGDVYGMWTRDMYGLGRSNSGEGETREWARCDDMFSLSLLINNVTYDDSDNVSIRRGIKRMGVSQI